MRIMALITMVLGLASLVLGVVFIFQASTGAQQIADSIAPLKLDEVNPKYDVVAMNYSKLQMAEEPNIQAQKAAPSDMYNYLSAQRALLGLAKSNIGSVNAVRTNGIVDILVGLGLILTGTAIFRKTPLTA